MLRHRQIRRKRRPATVPFGPSDLSFSAIARNVPPAPVPLIRTCISHFERAVHYARLWTAVFPANARRCHRAGQGLWWIRQVSALLHQEVWRLKPTKKQSDMAP